MPTIDNLDLLGVLQDSNLFTPLEPEQLETVSRWSYAVYVPQGENVYGLHDSVDRFYLVIDGRINLLTSGKKGKEDTITIGEGNYFGEEAFGIASKRHHVAYAQEDTTLLVLDRAAIHALLINYPKAIPHLELIFSSRRLGQSVTFNFLEEDEIVYFLGRKHLLFLWRNLIAPAILLLSGPLIVIFTWWQVCDWIKAGVICGGVFSLVGELWLIWNTLDWWNDYYMVTNKRVVWLERIAGIYDSRQEAPLDTLLSVDVETNLPGRWLDYGNVIVRTYTGNIIFRRIGKPDQVSALIKENWTRSKSISREIEKQAFDAAIRQRLGLDDGEAIQQTPSQQAFMETPIIEAPEVKSNILERILANFLQLRFEEKNHIITYRKHWFILLRATWKLWLLFILGLVGWALRIFEYISIPSYASLLFISVFYFSILIVWIIYEYVDWRNDIFQLTPEQIIDIHRKPLGSEEKRAAPLENILSIRSQRLGIVGILLNFGTVFIKVGDSSLNFQYVYNPSMVQKDIFRAMAERVQRKKKAEMVEARERAADWISTYHHNVVDKHRTGNFPDDDNISR